MNDPLVESVVDQLINGRLTGPQPSDWRDLVDIAADFLPPHQAGAVAAILGDPGAQPSELADAVASANPLEIDDSHLLIGSVEPDSLDFEVAQELGGIDGLPSVDSEPMSDLEFGSGDVSYESDGEMIGLDEESFEPVIDFSQDVDGTGTEQTTQAASHLIDPVLPEPADDEESDDGDDVEF